MPTHSAEVALPWLDLEALPRLIDDLVGQGWFAAERFVDDALCQALHAE